METMKLPGARQTAETLAPILLTVAVTKGRELAARRTVAAYRLDGNRGEHLRKRLYILNFFHTVQI